MKFSSIFCVTAAAAGIAMQLHADTDWIVRPRDSASGLMMVHCCREAQKQPALGIRFDTPKNNKRTKYSHMRIGGRDGGCYATLNEYGLLVAYTAGDPTHDKNPPKTASVFNGHNATIIIGRSYKTAAQAVGRLHAEFKKKQIFGSMIFFIADPLRAFVVECSPRHFASWELPHAFCVYAGCWKLPGMDDGSKSDAKRAAHNYQREWAARELLRQARDAKGTISVADSIAASRATADQMNDSKFDKARGKMKVVTGPCNKRSIDSYLFELDGEFPAFLSVAYAAWGPQRHTVYLPIPIGAADSLPKELFAKEWTGGAVKRMQATPTSEPIRQELLDFEAKQLKEFSKIREKARNLLRTDKPAEAKKLLRDTLHRQAKETAAFLNGLK